MTTAPRTLVVVAHPDPDSLTWTVAGRAAERLAELGGVEVADLHGEGFDPVFSPDDHRHYRSWTGAATADVVAEQARIDRAAHLVLVFPVYWWSMPAMLKGWVDRVFVNGWAFDNDPDTGISPRLGDLTIHLVAVAGADDGLYQRHGYEKSMRNQLEHGVIEYCGAVPGSTVFLHDSENRDPAVREAALDRAVAELVTSVTTPTRNRLGRITPSDPAAAG
ncbi:NAD(P)H-dependent oxidoreductase [Nocardioides hwasunensis]|uniref:NAD(P)H-dependent oxidoreductase n=1 Tax=Nocardioides hwasunensis TaxID=397258 RepID=A0ABR8MLG6_9ACTN|nr:NAD(P)H-dependent oxidoreductase [Nocardioides hwasunensis]MBD3915906.1 NAD(P)H-dependent oxidoreductase [Nocardioides hwasunensis]